MLQCLNCRTNHHWLAIVLDCLAVPATLCLIPGQLTKRAPAPGPIAGSLGRGHEEKHHQHHRHQIVLILGDDVGWLRLLT